MATPKKQAVSAAKPARSGGRPSARSKTAAQHHMSVKDLLKPFRITDGKGFRLKDHSTEDDRKDFDF
eukprot:gene12248-16502_t